MLRLTTAIAAALPVAQAILASPDSPCSTTCGNVLDSTSPADLVCDRGGFSGTTGQLFQGCLECEMHSGFHDGNRSDVKSMLYNMRYAVSYCLFGEPVNPHLVNTPCITSKACGPLMQAIEFKNVSAKYDGYEYCELWPLHGDASYKACSDCLRASETYRLANFITSLQAGCEQRPAAGIGLGIEGNVFSADRVNVTAPSPTATVDPAWFDRGPLTLNAKVGIAVGALVFLLILLGCFIVLNGKRRRRNYLRKLEAKYTQRGWPAPNGPGEKPEGSTSQRPHRGWDDTPLSQKPLCGWDDSPMTASTEKAYPRYFSPYSSQYNSPVSANNNSAIHMPIPNFGVNRDLSLSFGAEEADGAHSGSSSLEGKGKNREEAYEMHQVDHARGGTSGEQARMPRAEAPLLSHPGFGRAGQSHPQQYAVNDVDVHMRNAI
ncbi:hypothetical protein HIM_06452 [Hirsutella minnesotensis 3608]|uniref:LPXTG-domain-containing protein n=1 Tax=Hirsutella minnesotensis 3608 TaxID=1043627 RepID=A0A0F7ZJ90_9HYPO|nr:hypothetical protein HIM_06452 [Hirsutella minnesotensis 3608]